MRRSFAVLFAGILVGCGSTKGGGGELSYGDVQSIHAGLSAKQVIDAFGQPARSQRSADGRVEILDYVALDAKGGRAHLILEFDAREVLVRRTYTGEVNKP